MQPRAPSKPLGGLPQPRELASGRPKVELSSLSTTRYVAWYPDYLGMKASDRSPDRFQKSLKMGRTECCMQFRCVEAG